MGKKGPPPPSADGEAPAPPVPKPQPKTIKCVRKVNKYFTQRQFYQTYESPT